MSLISTPSGIPGRAALRRLLRADVPVPPRSEGELAAEVERNYRWNFTFNLVDGVIFWVGFSFASASTIVPLFISKLTPNPMMIALVAIIIQAGWYLPQLFTAGPIERLARKKPVVINLGFFLERLPVWLWPLSALAVLVSPSLALVIFLTSYTWRALGAGAIGPAWQDLIANCFPVNRRGRFFGTTMFTGAGLAVLGALASSWLLEVLPYPYNFACTFFVAALGINLSWIFLALTREPVRPVSPPPPGNNHLMTKLGHIWQQDDNYRHFLVARLLMVVGGMGVGFMTVAAVERWQIADSTVGLFTVALLLGQTVGNLFSGLLADRFGHKLSLELSGLMAFLSFLVAWLAPSPEWYYAAFALWGLSTGGLLVSGMLVVLELASPAQRPTYVGLTNSALGFASALAPLIGGWLAGYGYSWVFAMSAGVTLLSLIMLRWRVREPRWHTPT